MHLLFHHYFNTWQVKHKSFLQLHTSSNFQRDTYYFYSTLPPILSQIMFIFTQFLWWGMFHISIYNNSCKYLETGNKFLEGYFGAGGRTHCKLHLRDYQHIIKSYDEVVIKHFILQNVIGLPTECPQTICHKVGTLVCLLTSKLPNWVDGISH